MNIKNALLTAAVGGILAGATGCGGGATPQPNTPSGSDATPAAAPAKHSCTGSGMGAAPAPAPEKHSCTGMKSGGDDSSGGSDTGGGDSGGN